MTYVDCHCLIKFAYKIFISKKRRDKVFFTRLINFSLTLVEIKIIGVNILIQILFLILIYDNFNQADQLLVTYIMKWINRF